MTMTLALTHLVSCLHLYWMQPSNMLYLHVLDNLQIINLETLTCQTCRWAARILIQFQIWNCTPINFCYAEYKVLWTSGPAAICGTCFGQVDLWDNSFLLQQNSTALENLELLPAMWQTSHSARNRCSTKLDIWKENCHPQATLTATANLDTSTEIFWAHVFQKIHFPLWLGGHSGLFMQHSHTFRKL